MILTMMACVIACLFGVSGSLHAEEDMASDYSQVVYDHSNGLGGNEINCVYQTQTGYIWVGTDAGLYRYNGNEFKAYNLWETEKDDIYCINCLFQDDKGRLWIGTDNYGLFYIQSWSIYHFTAEYYSGVKNVNDVEQDANGRIYVATNYGLYYVDEDNLSLTRNDELAGKSITDLTIMDNMLWGIYGGNRVFYIDKADKLHEREASHYTQEELTCITSDGNYIYIGTSGIDIIKLASFLSSSVVSSGRVAVNSINIIDDKKYICADGGIGYLDKNDEYHSISGLSVNTYFSSIIKDYEGNFWLSSYRLGLLKLGLSKFYDYTMIPDSMTNCVEEIRDRKYIGTDNGLYIVNESEGIISNELTEHLKSAKINYIIRDDRGNAWICTQRGHGIVRAEYSGEYKDITKENGMPSNVVNSAVMLSNGNIAAATDNGIAIIDLDGNVVRVIGEADGLSNRTITRLEEDESGVIYAGTESGGLYAISNDRITNYSQNQGLTSTYITALLYYNDKLFIGTDNGLFLLDGSIRQITNIDYSTNIYDMIERDDNIWLITSKGVLRTSQDELLSTTGLNSRFWSYGDGLSKTTTITSRNCIDRYNILYICCNDGLMTMDILNIPINNTHPKFSVSEINIDGTSYTYDQIGGNLTVPSDTTRITISFSLLTFVNRENAMIRYMLSGVDSEPVTIKGDQPMQVIYTNLEGGEYVFTLSAENGDGVGMDSEVSFNIKKEYKFWEYTAVKIAMIVAAMVFIFFVITITIRLRKQVSGKEYEIAELSKENDDVIKFAIARTDYIANMNNEIKIPINAIIKVAEDMRDTTSDKDTETRDKLNDIISSGNDVVEKIDKSLLLAQLDAGRVKVVSEPYSVTTLMCNLSDMALNLIGDRPVRFIIDLGENIPDILVGDYEKIKIIISYIIENAIKYTKEGSVTMTVDSFDYSDDDGNKLVNLNFTVADTGIGIREEDLENIFNLNSKSFEKSGISLVIAKRLADLMYGEITAESTYGVGSTFTVSLYEKKSVKKVLTGAAESEVTMISREEAEKLLTPEVMALLVDDLEVSRTVALGVLDKFEISTDIATSGLNAIDMVMNKDYDIVFLDTTLAVMSGEDAMKEIRGLYDKNKSSVTIIAMSEDATGMDREELLAAGFDDIILKPMDMRVVAGVLKKYIDPAKLKIRPSATEHYISESKYYEGLKMLGDEADIVTGIEKVGGNIDIYNKYIKAFYDQNRNAPEEFRKNELIRGRVFRNRIHNIKSGCGNIGLFGLFEETIRMESAINKSNREYIKNNIGIYTDYLEEVLLLLKEYIDFVDKIKGISEDDLTEILRKEQEERNENRAREVIDLEDLTSMKGHAELGDLDLLVQDLARIEKYTYGVEDTDFINALKDAVETENYDVVLELIGTYIDLKH